MEIVHGDLIQLALAGRFDAIVHGCNCFCEMGAGIASVIRETFPTAFEADKATRRSDRNKLGTTSSARVDVAGQALTVVNAYTQFHWRGRKPLADYDAIRRAFESIRADFAGMRIGYPRIGAGLAGGDWSIISSIIDEELEGQQHTLVEFAG